MLAQLIFFASLVNGTGAAWLNAFENAIDMNINAKFVNPDEVINTDCETWIKQVDWVQLNDSFLFYNFPIAHACAESEWDKLLEIKNRNIEVDNAEDLKSKFLSYYILCYLVDLIGISEIKSVVWQDLRIVLTC